MADDGWNPGDLVRILDGPFAELMGTVEEVDAEQGKLRVHLAVLGAGYHVELDFDAVEAYDPDDLAPGDPRWPRGTPVRIIAGPFQHLRGVVQSAHDHCGRVVVRLSGLRPEVAIELSSEDIERA